MFFRTKKSGPRTYLQIVENHGVGDQIKQRVIATLGRLDDYRKGHVRGAVNLPNGQWHKATGLSRNKLNILYCYSQTCHLAAEAAVELTSRDYPVVEMEGGFEGWKASGYAIENGQATPAAQAG